MLPCSKEGVPLGGGISRVKVPSHKVHVSATPVSNDFLFFGNVPWEKCYPRPQHSFCSVGKLRMRQQVKIYNGGLQEIS